LKAFQRDGYIVISGLLDENDVESLVQAGEEIVQTKAKTTRLQSANTFSVVEKGIMFTPSQNENQESSDSHVNESMRAFRTVALRSKLSQIAAELMQLDPKRQNIRILR